MKYEAKYDGYGTAVSTAAGAPCCGMGYGWVETSGGGTVRGGDFYNDTTEFMQH